MENRVKMMVCNRCGRLLPKNSLFCNYCGSRIIDESYGEAHKSKYISDWASDVPWDSETLEEWLGDYKSSRDTKGHISEDRVAGHNKETEDNAEKPGQRDKRKGGFAAGLGIFLKVAVMLFFAFSVLVSLSLKWALSKWAELTVDEIVFQLSHSLKGTGSEFIVSYLLSCILPTVIIVAIAAFAIFIFSKRKPVVSRALSLSALVMSFLLLGISVYFGNKNFKVTEYVKANSETSDFIGSNYVAPESVRLLFPSKKRNLIYIFVESLEITFADELHGGAFPENFLPELTALSAQGDMFNGPKAALNGGYSLPGSHYTMAAIVSQTMGLPIKTIGNQMESQDSFYGGITNLGDILAEQNYKQVFMLGSDATFGGRRLYFEEHGNYEIDDYPEAKKQGIIPEDYKEWWGYEDEKLFDWAKLRVSDLAASDQPFNLTLLTADTHFEDGYICGLCRDDFGNNQYANVYACADRQLVNFVHWVQQQSFYDNTTIIISGDHPTMDKDFCENISSDYARRVFTLVLNPDTETAGYAPEHVYSTFDIFPTTLAALGVSIQGNRLGLGTNLYSKEQTCIEKYGLAEVREELKKKSTFMDSLQEFELNDRLIRSYVDIQPYYRPEWNVIRYYVFYNLSKELFDLDKIVIRGKDQSGKLLEVPVNEYRENAYQGNLNISEFKGDFVDVQVVAIDKGGEELVLDEIHQDTTLLSNNFEDYLSKLNSKKNKYDIFLSSWGYTTAGLSGDDYKAMEELGIDTSFEGNDKILLCAVIENGKIEQQNDPKSITMAGNLLDGTTYNIDSGDPQFDASCSIAINGQEYARNYSGFNCVVYDPEARIVVDRSVFSLSKKYTAKLEISGTSSVQLRVSGVEPGGISKISVNIGEGDNKKTYDVKEDDNGIYTLTIENPGVNIKEAGITVDGWDEFGRLHRIEITQ